MELYIKYLINHSSSYALIAIAIISFLESFAIVGLFVPGILLMTLFGSLIGCEKIKLYPLWIISTFFCLLGDWTSYYIGFKFHKHLIKFNFLKKNQIFISKTKKSLCYNTLTIFIGKFIGPTRSIVPLLSGMLNIPIKKFIIPNLFSCFLWPIIYFFPGIFTSVAFTIPNNNKKNFFSYLLIFTMCVIWLNIFLFLKLWNYKINKNLLISITKIKILFFASIFVTIINVIFLFINPQILILKKILYTIFL
ncbi:DedA family protein [Buchnera aphidicola (Taiwanaphis decaspermi)]|uniref:DedA family protein n=1 Tax=Buchnera aphidicola TaxID=9 RepID=UPI0031B8AE16